MKVKIFSLLFVFIFYGCEPFINVSTENHYLTNKVEKEFVVKLSIISDDCNKDSIQYFVNRICYDSLMTTFVCNSSSSVKPPFIVYGKCSIYNISDTTYVSDIYPYTYLSVKLSKFLIFNEGDMIKDSKAHQNNQINNYFLTIDDELLKLMNKDYSMLTKFKEYYRK